MNELEENKEIKLDFKKIAKVAAGSKEVIPVAIQNIDSGEVVLLAYTNEEAFKKSVESRSLILWSTSRNELWEKGKTSDNTFELIEVYVNCEQNSLLYKVRSKNNNICHTTNKQGKPRNCFYRKLNMETLELENLDP